MNVQHGDFVGAGDFVTRLQRVLETDVAFWSKMMGIRGGTRHAWLPTDDPNEFRPVCPSIPPTSRPAPPRMRTPRPVMRCCTKCLTLVEPADALPTPRATAWSLPPTPPVEACGRPAAMRPPRRPRGSKPRGACS